MDEPITEFDCFNDPAKGLDFQDGIPLIGLDFLTSLGLPENSRTNYIYIQTGISFENNLFF